MKKTYAGMVFALIMLSPSLAFAKGIPLFFQTGDELFEIENSPVIEGEYSVGYACKRFGLFGADLWTWDCRLSAVNITDFSVMELNDEELSEFSSKYHLTNRKRNPWNHYGAALLLVALIGSRVFKSNK